MREIKFRVWDKREAKGSDTKEMLYNAQNHRLWHDFLDYPESYEVMQFTGQHDIKNKEIYEGDIIKWDAGYDKFSKVVYNEHHCRFFLRGDEEVDVDGFYDKFGMGFLHPYNYEIIGNIHENPELLEKLKIL